LVPSTTQVNPPPRPPGHPASASCASP